VLGDDFCAFALDAFSPGRCVTPDALLVAPYVVVLIMLVVRPNGLFGEKLRKKV